MGASEDGPCKNVGGLYLALGEFEGNAPNSWTDQRMSSLVFEISFFSACCWLDVGRQPSWHRQASPVKYAGASLARTVSHCDRGRVRSWRFEAFLDAPAGFFDPDQCLDRGALGTPCREIGHITIRGLRRISRPRVQSLFCVHRIPRRRGQPVRNSQS